MGLFRYIVQGFGWEIGSQAAREGIASIDRLREIPADEAPTPEPTAREVRQRERTARRLERVRRVETAKREAEIEAQLAELKRRTKH